MIINSNILKRFIDADDNIAQTTNQYIIEVEHFGLLNSSSNVVSGKVITCKKHPNSDHLHVTTVDVGDSILQIVCGASNVRADQYVLVAKVGAVLPGNFVIKEATIRGVASSGMICSLRELGIGDKYLDDKNLAGIFSFDEPVPLGVSGLDLIGQSGFLLELGLTPNRADLLSHYGFAQDLAAVLDTKIKEPIINSYETKKASPIKVSIESQGCGRYYGRVVNVTVKDSPWWLKSALISAGIRPINNVVDITNYVLIEYGTPLHAFDANKVATKEIVVRNAVTNEKVVCLDGSSHELLSSDVVVTDGKRTIAIAGVMGLENTMVSDDTTQIILEAAYFDPKHVSATSKRLGLRSESSLRFERGVNDQIIETAMNRAVELLVTLAQGSIDGQIARAVNYELNNETVSIKKNMFAKILGTSISQSNIIDYFKRLNCQFSVTANDYIVKAPAYRNDLQIAANFIAEVGRLYGFNKIKNKPLALEAIGGLSHSQKIKRSLRSHFSALGLNEVVSYSLVGEKELATFNKIGAEVAILNPLSEDKKYLRQSLISGVLDAMTYNSNRGIDQLAFFEIGSVFANEIEKTHLAVGISGTWIKTNWLRADVNSSFFLLKGILEQVLSSINVNLNVLNEGCSFLHPGISGKVVVNNKAIGMIGKLHPKIANQYQLDDLYLLEIDLTDILASNPQQLQFSTPSKYPTVTRDLSFVVAKEHEVSKITELIYQTGRKVITNVDIIDVYTDAKLGLDYHSLAVRITFNDVSKTLDGDDVAKVIKSIKNRLEFNFKAVIRD